MTCMYFIKVFEDMNTIISIFYKSQKHLINYIHCLCTDLYSPRHFVNMSMLELMLHKNISIDIVNLFAH